MTMQGSENCIHSVKSRLVRLDDFVKSRVAVPMAALFPELSPQSVGIDFVHAAALLLMARIFLTVVLVEETWLEIPDLMGFLLVGLALMVFVVRKHSLKISASRVSLGALPYPSTFRTRMLLTLCTLGLLAFNLVCFFPGDFYFTMDVAVFLLLTLSAHFQGIRSDEARLYASSHQDSLLDLEKPW